MSAVEAGFLVLFIVLYIYSLLLFPLLYIPYIKLDIHTYHILAILFTNSASQLSFITTLRPGCLDGASRFCDVGATGAAGAAGFLGLPGLAFFFF